MVALSFPANKALRLAAALALLVTTGCVRCLAQSLREYADRAGVLVGAAAEPRFLSEPEYAATLAREFNMLTAENAMKWGAIRPDRVTFNFGPGDRLVAFAQQHRMKVRGHTLLWGEYNPAWLAKGQFTPEQMAMLLREHITQVMRHYKGKVFAWDVVNEVFLADGQVEPSIWYDQPGIGLKGQGTAYVEQAFRWARAADPDALLFYNDYGTEGINPKSDAVYAMVKDFKSRGVPIDGVGLQMHVSDLEAKSLATLEANIARLVALGVEVHITEMDVGLPVDAGGRLANAGDLVRQAEIYRQVATVCLRQPRCTAFQTWGFTDKYTWIPNFTKGAKGMPLPFDRQYGRKPAYDALLDALRQRALGPRAQSPSAAPPQQKEIAVTFDDLPLNGPRIGSERLRAMTDKLLAGINRHQIPVVGFVNESLLYVPGETDAMIAILKAWPDAGVELANHTFSHLRFKDVTLAEYQDDVVRGDTLTRMLMKQKGRQVRYFRHPFLKMGVTRELEQSFENFLAERGYRIAPVTVDTLDWEFNSAYAKSRDQGDAGMAERVSDEYLKYAGLKFDFCEKVSTELFGRRIRHILLLHANELNADNFDGLVKLLKDRGYRFITLEQALEDPVYQFPERYKDTADWLLHWSSSKGMKFDPPPPEFIRKLNPGGQ